MEKENFENDAARKSALEAASRESAGDILAANTLMLYALAALDGAPQELKVEMVEEMIRQAKITVEKIEAKRKENANPKNEP